MSDRCVKCTVCLNRMDHFLPIFKHNYLFREFDTFKSGVVQHLPSTEKLRDAAILRVSTYWNKKAHLMELFVSLNGTVCSILRNCLCHPYETLVP